ncbi:MAG: hypothetical protein GX575_25015 [Candidatus Anammoximicrobium sp.]|nr:hypothetical protein [Candidatus Anammoximicrobium sp.]
MELDYPYQRLFQPMFKVNIVSKDQDAADNAKDPDSIMWKIMFALESLPWWMRGEPKVDYRSPWYDNECLRPGANPVSIAQELDMSFTGDTARYFPDGLVDRLLRDTAKPPVVRGELSFTTDDFKPRWLAMPDGRFQLWFQPELGKYAPPDLYVVSADIGMGLGGSGGSNSALTVLNRRTRRKVASFVVPNMLPYLFAEMAIAACWWFKNDRGGPAFLAWEANGPGQEFQKRVLETDFRDFYYRKYADVVTKRATNKPGYWTQKRSELLGPYREALMEGQYVNPDAAALEELRQYSIGPDGEPFHNAENQKEDPTGAKKAHADRVVADAVGWIAALDFGRVAGGTVREALNVMNVTPGNAPLGSYAWRRAEHLVGVRKGRMKSRW